MVPYRWYRVGNNRPEHLMAVMLLPNNHSCHWEAISINKHANKKLRQNSAGDGTGSLYTREMTSNCFCLLIFVPLTYSAFGYLNWPFNFLNICFESVIVNQQWGESLIGFQSKISGHGFQVNYLYLSTSIFLCYWTLTKFGIKIIFQLSKEMHLTCT